MSTYKIQAEYSLHEGGTKFYQTIMIQEQTTRRAVVVTHWGAHHSGASERPGSHGQRKIELHESGGVSAFSQARRNKEKRGYNSWRSTASMPSASLTDYKLFLREWFNLKDEQMIKDYFEPKLAGKSPSLIIDDVPVTNLFDIKPPEPPKPAPSAPKHEDWGTW